MTQNTLTALSPHTPVASTQSVGETMLSNIVDVINPLQHIPFISQVYRSIADDPISAGANIVGGGLFGGVIGAAASAVTAMIEGVNGEPVLLSASHFMHTMTDDMNNIAPIYAPVNTIILQSDEGQALVAMMQDGTFTPDQVIATDPTTLNPAVASTVPLRDFREARPLGIASNAIEEQLKTSLLIDIKNL